MAGNDTAALVVALSAQLTKFEKDMKGAVDIARKRTDEIETNFSKFNKNVQTQMSGFATATARQLGPVGDVMMALGPAGFVAAAALGAIVLAATYANAQVNALAARAGQLRDFGETVGLSVERVQALVVAGADVGLSSEKVETGIGRMVVALEELRNGSGKAYDAVRQINPELVVQLQRTRDTERSVDLLAKAWERMDTAQRLTLARGLFGRDPGQSRLLGQIAEAGSLEQLQRNLSRSITLTSEQAKKLDDLRDASERLRNSAWEKFWSIGAENVLKQQMESAEQLDAIATWLKRISEIEIRQEIMDLLGFGRAPVRITVHPELSTGVVPLPRARPADAPGGEQSIAARLALLREQNALLGDAITPMEQLRQKQLEVAAAVEKDSRLREAAVHGLEAFEAAMAQAVVAALQRLGIAREQEIVDAKLAALQKDKIKFGFTENRVQQATVIILREAKQAAEALEVRRAYLPGLKQLELDAKNVRKGLDELGVNGMRAFEDGLVDIATRTKSVSAAFTDMANSIIKDIARMLIRQNITGPLAGLIGGLLGGGDADKIVAAAKLPGNAAGTNNWRGGWSWVGERGPELLNLPRGSQVIPNDVARGVGGSQVIAPVYNIDASGADPAAIDRMMRGLEQTNVRLAQQGKAMASAGYTQRNGVRLSS